MKIIFLLFLVCSCFQTEEQVSPLLYRSWIHSREEDSANIRVYRTEEYNFPPSRGRERIKFNQDGTFTFFTIASHDGLTPQPGEWKEIAPGILRLEFNDKTIKSIQVEILEAAEDRLQLRMEQ